MVLLCRERTDDRLTMVGIATAERDSGGGPAGGAGLRVVGVDVDDPASERDELRERVHVADDEVGRVVVDAQPGARNRVEELGEPGGRLTTGFECERRAGPVAVGGQGDERLAERLAARVLGSSDPAPVHDHDPRSQIEASVIAF